MALKRVVVVGSLNCDLVMRVGRMPERGETVFGKSFHTFVGGKGCNQAIAAARAGASVDMVGRVGSDEFGARLISALGADGIDCAHVAVDREIGTGVADILVDDDGDNRIAIAPQANGRLSREDVALAAALFDSAGAILIQLEIPLEAALVAAELGHARGRAVILNPAPAPPSGVLPEELIRATSIVVPNQSEAEIMTGVRVTDFASAIRAGRELRALGFQRAIVTLGELGAVDCDAASATEVEAFRVNVVDTTAAGDAFVGALSAAIVDGRSVADAIRFGCAAGALAATKLGAEPSLPRRAEIEGLVLANDYPPAAGQASGH
jgi:ribokinase